MLDETIAFGIAGKRIAIDTREQMGYAYESGLAAALTWRRSCIDDTLSKGRLLA
jgi:hypothetical protein